MLGLQVRGLLREHVMWLSCLLAPLREVTAGKVLLAVARAFPLRHRLRDAGFTVPWSPAARPQRLGPLGVGFGQLGCQ